MKKSLFILATAALVLASCNKNEPVAENLTLNDANEITFQPLVKRVMRTYGPMAGTSFAVGDIINVYADWYDASATSHSKYFQADFTKQSTGGFTSANKYYWPAFDTDDKMTFTAIYGGTQVVGTPGKVEAFSPNATAASQMDLMVAKKELTAKETPVMLNFRHALSQVVVKVKNTNANLDFDITGVRIGYLNTTGEFNYNYNYSTSSADEGAVTTPQEVEVDANAGNLTTSVTLVKSTNWSRTAVTDANTNKYDQTISKQAITSTQGATALTGLSSWLLIPQTQTGFTAYTSGTQVTPASANPVVDGAYIALELEIYNYNGSARSNKLVAKQWCYWPVSLTWNPGYKYTYTVDLAGGGYQPGNVDAAEATTLDPVLGDAIVFSPDCTIDYWVVSDLSVPAE
jgi:hypothetical protein